MLTVLVVDVAVNLREKTKKKEKEKVGQTSVDQLD
mgnify:CR=1 FL=1